MSFGSKRLNDAYDDWKTQSPYEDEEKKLYLEEQEDEENTK